MQPDKLEDHGNTRNKRNRSKENPYRSRSGYTTTTSSDEFLKHRSKLPHGNSLVLRQISHAAKALDVEFELRPPERADGFVEFLNELDTKMDKLKIDVMIEGARVHNSIALDGPWRDKIHTYVVVIKQIVESAMDLPVQIRETILKRLQEFDAEVSRTRTRVQVFTDVFVSLCEELNAGAVALTPAVRLGERIIGALARLQGEPPVLSLPAPEEFNLPPPDVIEPSPDHQLSGPHSSSGSTQ